MIPKASEYKKRISQQIAQYKNVKNMHGSMSDTFTYWATQLNNPRFREATKLTNFYECYKSYFVTAIEETGNNRLASFGSGEARVEIQLAKLIKDAGVADFQIECLELSPFQNERATELAAEAGVSEHIVPIVADFNSWRPEGHYAGFMAHHALHHVQELEHLFDAIKDGMLERSAFVTFDVIGRNGHMRWPETYELVNKMWQFLPPEKREHTILKRIDDEFFNHDCSTHGFEGIRAQDIMPELLKRFNFEMFVSWGGMTDVFVSRGYGGNFDISIKEDRGFIEFIDFLNELLLDLGHIKPTVMGSVLKKHEVESPRIYKDRTPEKMTRIVD